MLNGDTHKLLVLFGDAKPHSFFETIVLSKILLKKSDRQIEKIFKRHLLENGWVRRLWKSYEPRLDFYELTPKGDAFFRAVQVWRITRGRHTEDTIRHFRHFDRSVKGKYGVEGLGEHLSEAAAGLRERRPELYG